MNEQSEQQTVQTSTKAVSETIKGISKKGWVEMAELGQKYQIAWEVVKPILSDLHDDTVLSLQNGMLGTESLRQKNAVIHVIALISGLIETAIHNGQIAEEILANGGQEADATECEKRLTQN